MRRIARSIVCFLLIVLARASASSQDSPEQARRFALPPAFNGKAIVRVEPTKVSKGGSFRLVCEVHSKGGVTLYNPFLSEQSRLPARITITSADGKIRHELLKHAAMPDAQSDSADWLVLGSTGAIGRELEVQVASDEPHHQRSSRFKMLDLPPGEYLVQATYTYWLAPMRWANIQPASARPANADLHQPQPYGGWSKEQMDRVWFQSEPVKFVVADSSGAEPSRTDSAPDTTKGSLEAELRSDAKLLKFGQPMNIEIRLVNRSDAHIEVFNPLLSPMLGIFTRGTVLALINERGEPIDDVLHRTVGSSIAPTRENWATLPPGGLAVTTVKFWARGNNRVPGKYSLELRIHENVLAGRPWDLPQVERDRLLSQRQAETPDINTQSQLVGPNDERANRMRYEDWERTFPGPEVVRSSRLALEVLPRTGD